MAIPYTFATATAPLPLSQLDDNFTAVEADITAAKLAIANGTYALTTPVLGDASASSIQVTGVTTVTGNLQLTGDNTTAQNIATNQQTWDLNIGGVSGVTGTTYLCKGQTTGAITIGGNGATGALNIGQSNGAQAITIGGTAGSTNTIAVGSSTGTGTLTFGRSTASYTLNIGSGNTSNGNTRSILIGTGAVGTGVSNVTIGKFSATVGHIVAINSNTLNLSAGGPLSLTASTTAQYISTGINTIQSSGSNVRIDSYGVLQLQTQTLGIGGTAIGSGGDGFSLEVYHDFTNINSSQIQVGTSNTASTVTISNAATLNGSTNAISIGTNGLAGSTTNINIGSATGTSTTAIKGYFKPPALASAPTYVKGAVYFDTTLNKLRVGGATTWETITSV